MAQRDSIIEVVDLDNAPSWRFTPDELFRYLNRLGPEETKKQFMEQLDIGLDQAIRVWEQLKKTDPTIKDIL